MSEVYTRPVVDRATGKIAIERIQDVEDIIERNKRRQNEQQVTRGDGWHMIGEIPNIILEKWIVEDGISYKEMMSPDGFESLVKRKLRDPDYAWLRTTDKRF